MREKYGQDERPFLPLSSLFFLGGVVVTYVANGSGLSLTATSLTFMRARKIMAIIVEEVIGNLTRS